MDFAFFASAARIVSPLLLALGAWAAFAPLASAAPAKPTQKTKLALNWKPEPQFGGFYAADIAGAFKRRGLEAEIMPGGAGTPVVQMVAAGRAEFGVASGDEVVISRARGSDVVALFAVYQTNPQALMARPERGAANVRELFASAGPIALQRGLPYALYLLQKYPLSKAELVPYLGGVANYLADPRYAQQCFVTSEPLTAKKQGKPAKVFLVADEGFNPYTTVVIAREATLKAKPELAKAMVDAVREGWRAYLDDPKAANAAMAKLNPSLDQQTFVDSAEAQKPLIETAETKAKGLGSMTSARWQELAQQLLTLKLVDKAPSPETLYRNL